MILKAVSVGVALEHESRMTNVGMTFGKGHLRALALRTFRRQEWGWTLFKEVVVCRLDRIGLRGLGP